MSSQAKVGILFSIAAVSVIVFVAFLGQFSFLGTSKRIVVAYNFVGGLEQGSHVRVMGVKVGKVERLEFRPDYVAPSGEEVKLHVHLKINERAWPVVREDSRYYINMAGIIGEKFLEISPGSANSPQIVEGAVVRGEDPPRVDQLISQGYALAGKILAVVEANEGSITEAVGSLADLVKGLNKVMGQVDRLAGHADSEGLVRELKTLAKDMGEVLRGAKADGSIKGLLEAMRDILAKLDKIEEEDVRQFLQKEGIKARVTL
jgi:phospholipid/cholesterol/gamma-HCH transport system substrate-binding protein